MSAGDGETPTTGSAPDQADPQAPAASADSSLPAEHSASGDGPKLSQPPKRAEAEGADRDYRTKATGEDSAGDRKDADTEEGSGDDERAEETDEVRNASRLERFFFLKTTFGMLLTAILFLGGILAYGVLTKEALPDLDIPAATITTTWAGADPRSIEEQVTDPIEDELTSLSGVSSINSASYDSFSVISVEFEASVDSASAMAELRAAVNDAEAELPSAAEAPTVTQISVNDLPILTLALHGSGDERTLSQLGRDIRDRLERIAGVDEVALGGEREEVVQILLQPDRLLALGVSPLAVRDAVQGANVQQPFGEVRGGEGGGVVRLEGRFRNLDDLRALPVARQGEVTTPRAVRLDEVATVRRTLEAEETRAFFTTRGSEFAPAIELSITKTPGADTVEVVGQIREELDAMAAGEAWPAGIRYSVVQDGAENIWSSLGQVFSSGVQSMLIVFAILFITIAWREALITGLAIPITFAGVLLFLLLFGQTLNELVIIGMVIALVLIIDVFIILMEGLHDELYIQKATFGQAVLRTVRRYATPAFAAQLTTILALVPLMAIGGTAGEFIRILPLTTVMCLVIAFVLALFGAMPLSRYLLGKRRKGEKGEAEESRSDRVTRKSMDWLEDWNGRNVVASRKHAWGWVIGAVAMFVLSLVAFSQTRLELFPFSDAKQLGVNVELPPTLALDETQAIADRLGEIMRTRPYLENTVMLVGRRSPFAISSQADRLQPDEAENFIGFSSIFTERGERDGQSYDLADDLRAELAAWLDANVAGARFEVVPENLSPSSGDPIEIEISGPDMDELQRLSGDVQALLRSGGGVVEVRDNIGALNPEIGYQPDREVADLFGIPQSELGAQLRTAFSSDDIGDFGTDAAEDDIEIRLGTEWPSRPGEAGAPRSLSELALIHAYTPDGRPVSLAQLVRESRGEGAIAISHAGGERAVTVLARNQGRTVTEIVDALEPELEQLASEWPSGYSYRIGGEAEETGETFGSAGIALIVAILLVVGVLVIMFDSFAQAFIIVATMPLAIVGAFIGFFLFGLSFSFFAMIGVVSLIGIVINTGIIMVDTMNHRLREGASVAEAAAAGSARRLRPVITTSVTTIIGLVPLAISSDAYRPLTLVIIFGLVSATILSLFVVPALYLLLTKDDAGRETVLD